MIPLAQPQLGAPEKERVAEIIDSGYLTDGPEVREFEERFADFCGAKHGVATANGTTALHTAVEALGLGEGDRVVTTPFSFIGSANAIRLAGATPVFADIDSRTFNLDPAAVERTIEAHEARGESIDAILAVHLFGLPADMPRLCEIADEHDLAVIEDAAQAHGAAIDGERVGTFGDVACFSFYPTKNMTTGEGGMVLTDDRAVAARAAGFVNHGRPATRFGEEAADDYDHATLGHNFRMSSVLAAIGNVQLRERLRDSNETRREHAARLTEDLSGTVTTPVEPAGRRHVYHQYTIRSDDREALRNGLRASDIATGIYYPTPIHRQPTYVTGSDHEFGRDDDLSAAERAAGEVLSLPVHPALGDDDVDRIAAAVRAREIYHMNVTTHTKGARHA